MIWHNINTIELEAIRKKALQTTTTQKLKRE